MIFHARLRVSLALLPKGVNERIEAVKQRKTPIFDESIRILFTLSYKAGTFTKYHASSGIKMILTNI